MDLKLAGKKVLITGGASGLGDAAVRTFAEEGAFPVAVDINEAKLASQAEELEALGRRSGSIVADLSTLEGIEGAVARAKEIFGGAPDILVNNVGTGTLRTLEETTDEQFHRTMELNFFAMVRMCKLLVPEMKANGGGSVVSVTSDLSRQPEDSITDYAASKAAVASVSKSLSRLYAPTVRLNCVAPGPIYTPFWSDENYGWVKTVEQAYGKEGMDAIQALIDDRGIPMGRIGRPEEVAAAIAFLASDLSAFTTGATLGIDGGSIRALF
ncbi:SDR family oxidoreductase [Leucobacter weissii]|uniref:SDR family oxidoreductase n=1 Tax=Leucobacter weissii TaxID=1983706 RepID=A0A939MIG8_9MICO|nr:SDR family oxidoreductase [Leucobacter weissii]MBO1901529.1 SDR family oxidoreductase [Leucobacter weissii]